MIVTYEDVIPSLIPNTIMYKKFFDGVHKVYAISAIDGYVLHDNSGNWFEIDQITGEQIEREAYYTGTVTCGAAYDFTSNPREFYAVPEDSVPADQIFGGVNNDHEIA
jgi:hypothetical protein